MGITELPHKMVVGMKGGVNDLSVGLALNVEEAPSREQPSMLCFLYLWNFPT